MTCKISDVKKYLHNNKLTVTDGSNLDLLIQAYTQETVTLPVDGKPVKKQVTVELRQKLLDSVLTSSIASRNGYMQMGFAAAGIPVNEDFLLPDFDIDLTEADQLNIVRHSHSAGHNIVNGNTIVIGQGENQVGNRNGLLEEKNAAILEARKEHEKGTTLTKILQPLYKTLTTIKVLSNFLKPSKKKLNELFQKSFTLEEFVERNPNRFTTNADKKAVNDILHLRNSLENILYDENGNATLLNYFGNDNNFQNMIATEKWNNNDVLKYFFKQEIGANGGTVYRLDPLVLDSIAIATYDFMATKLLDSRFNDDATINQMFGRDSGDPLDPTHKALLRRGDVKAAVVAALGGKAFEMLGLRLKDNGLDGAFDERVKVSFGMLATTLLLENKIVRQFKLTQDQYPQQTEAQRNDPSKTFNRDLGGDSTLFLEPHPRFENEPTDRLLQITQNYKEATELKDALGMGSEKRFPLVKALGKVVTHAKNSFQEVPEVTREVLRKMQQEPWEIKNNLIDKLREYPEDIREKILGVIPQEQIDRMHTIDRMSAEDSNQKIRKAWDNLIEFSDKVLENKTDDWFMSYFISSSGRMYYDTNMIDILGDKQIARHAVGLKAFNVTVDSKELRKQFMLAVVLAFGGDIDKQSFATNEAEFEALMETYADTIKAIREGIATPEMIATALENIDPTTGKKEKINLHKFEGLQALAAYDADGPFQTNIAIETDAVTSGLALGLMQNFNMDNLEKLKAIGVFPNNSEIDYPTWREKKTNYDSYQLLAVTWNRVLQQLKKDDQQKAKGIDLLEPFIGSFVDNQEVVENEGRALAKDPLMVTNYGAAVAKAVRNITQIFVNKIYSDLTRINNIKDDTERKQATKDFVTQLSAIMNTDPNNNNRGLVLNPNNRDIREFKFTRDQKAILENMILESYGETLGTALNIQIGPFEEYRSYINIAFQKMFTVFTSIVRRDIELLEQEKGRLLSIAEVDRIIESRAEFMPRIKGPMSKGLADGISVLKKESIRIYDSKYTVQQQYTKKIEGTDSQSHTGYAKGNSFKDVGIGGAVISTHTLDSAIQQAVMAATNAITIHDAAFYGLDQVEKGTFGYNKATRDVALMGNFNMLAEAMRGVLSVQKNLQATINKAKPEDTAFFTSLHQQTFVAKEYVSVVGAEITFNDYRRLVGEKLHEILDHKERFRQEYPEFMVSHAAHNGGVYTESTENSSPVTESIIDNFTDQVLLDSKGSSGRTVDFDNFTALFENLITKGSMESIFHMMGNIGSKQASAEHVAHLQEVLKNVTKITTPIKIKVAETDETTFGVIRRMEDGTQDIHILGSKASVQNNVQMSAQEVYVHELVHAVTEYGIDSNPKLRNALKKIYKTTKAKLAKETDPWKMFLPADLNNPTAAEIKTAKDMYAYVFENASTETITTNSVTAGVMKGNPNEKKKVSNYLHEFVAFGLSNAEVMSYLSKIKITPDINTGSNPVEKLFNWFASVVESLSNRILGINNLSADKAVRRVVDQMLSTNEKKVFFLFQMVDSLHIANKVVVDKFVTWLHRPLMRYRRKNHTTKTGRRLSTLAGLLDKNTYSEMGEILGQMGKNAGITERSMATKLVRESLSLTENNSTWHTMIKISKKVIDQVRMHEADNVTKQVQEAFHKLPTRAQSEAIYKTFLKLDMSTFLDTTESGKYTPENIISLLRNPDVLDVFITNLEQEILNEFGNNGNYYIHQSRGLGSLMAQGKGFAHAQQWNAFNIANMKNTARATRGDVARAEKLIDELATLHGLKETELSIKEEASRVYEYENDIDGVQNGITQLLYLTHYQKKQSLEQLFKGKKALMQKGYTRDAYDPNVDVKISDGSSETQERMRGLGYNMVPEPLDPDVFDNSNPRYMYVNPATGNASWVKTIASLSSRQAAGMTLEHIYGTIQEGSHYHDASVATDRINGLNAGLIERQFRPGYKPNNVKFVPIMNEEGKIASYRYIMSEQLRDNLLKRDNRFDKAIGRTFASIVDKENSSIINRRVVEIAKVDYDANFTANPSKFIAIHARSEDPEIREIYKLLPKEMKQDIEDVWGRNEPLMIQEEFLNLIFGFRKMRLTDMDNITGMALRSMNDGITAALQYSFFPNTPYVNVGQLYGQLVDWIKELIVVRTALILGPNFISNNFLLFAKGVPIKNIGKYQTEAVIALDQYRKDTSRRDIIARTLKADPTLTPRQIKKLERELAELDTDLAVNPVSELMDAGIFQSIIEDVEIEDDIYSSKAKIAEFINGFANDHLHEFLHTPYKYAMLTKDTKVYQLLLKATQVSDFMARYALYRTRMDQRPNTVRSDEAKKQYRTRVFEEITETFINYDVPTSKEMQWLNDMGLLMFTKFYFRIQRIIVGQFLGAKRKKRNNRPDDPEAQARPISAAGVYLAESMFGPLEDIGDSSVIWFNLFKRLQGPIDVLDTATVFPGLEAAQNLM